MRRLRTRNVIGRRRANRLFEKANRRFGRLYEANRSLSDIALDIERNWSNVNYAARPYLEAMFSLNDINDYYMYDSGRSIVLYFLANASSWRGPVAKSIKAELKSMLKR